MGADLAVVAGAVRAELRHLPEHRDVRGRRLERDEVVQRRAHRDRVGVVAVVHEDDSGGQLDQLAAQAREGYPRRADAPFQRPAPRAPPRSRSPPGRSSRLWASANGNRNRARRAGVADRRLDRAPSRRRVEREDVAAGAERDRHQALVEVGLERLRVGRHDRAAAAGQAGEELGLRLGDRLERAEQLEVDRADVGDRRRRPARRSGRARRSARARASPSPAPGPRSPAARSRIASGSPISVLKFSRAGVDPHRQDRVADVLDRGLAHRAGDPDHRGTPAPAARRGPAPGGRPADRRRPRTQPPRLGVRAARARPLRLDHHAPGARPRAPPRRTRPPRRARRGGRRTGPRAGPRASRSRRRSAGARPPPARTTSAPAAAAIRSGASSIKPRTRRGAGAAPRVATWRSSKGIFRPPSNSWPCSWPLPAITTVSPARGPLERERDRRPAGPASTADAASRAIRRSRPGSRR